VFYDPNNASAPNANCIVTGGWDDKISYWDTRIVNKEISSFKTSSKVHALDSKQGVLAVAAGSTVLLFDVRDASKPFKAFSYDQCLSVIKHVRSIGLFSDGQGVVAGTCEGRAIVESYVESRETAAHLFGKDAAGKSFPYRCHRVPRTTNDKSQSSKGEDEKQVTDCYAVNAVHFHPNRHSLFLTAGGDGSFVIWNKDKKIRIQQFLNPARKATINNVSPDVSFTSDNLSLIAAKFSSDASLIIYAHSYDWSRGYHNDDRKKPPSIWVHAFNDKSLEGKDGK
jgi:mRNA export factor